MYIIFGMFLFILQAKDNRQILKEKLFSYIPESLLVGYAVYTTNDGHNVNNIHSCKASFNLAI